MAPTTTPADILADWLEATPPSMGAILAYRVSGMLPRSVDVLRADTPEGVQSLAAWVRACSDGILQSAGVALMVAALIDHVLTAPSLNQDHAPFLDTDAARERYQFMQVQDRRLRESWRALRADSLSTRGIDRWANDVVSSLLPPT